MAKREGRKEGWKEKNNAKRRGRVKEDNPCIRWIYVSVEMQKRFHAVLRMYTTDVFSLSYLKKKKKSSSSVRITYHSELPFFFFTFSVDSYFRSILRRLQKKKKFTKIIEKPLWGFLSAVFILCTRYYLHVTLLYLRTFRKGRKAERYEECRRDWQRYTIITIAFYYM